MTNIKTPEQLAEEILDGYSEQLHIGDVRVAVEAAIRADQEQRSPYVLSFEPDAIRDHFEADEDDPTREMTDEQLLTVAASALQDDRLYQVFHELLVEWVS